MSWLGFGICFKIEGGQYKLGVDNCQNCMYSVGT